jgi:MerC mercury resistance protein
MKVAQLFNEKADYIGITGSVLCIIHCLITPVLLVTSNLMTQHSTLRVGFLSLDYVFIGVNIVAVYFATRHYAAPGVRVALWGCLTVFTVAILFEDVNPVFEYLGYAASLGLVSAHLFNIRQHRQHHSH